MVRIGFICPTHKEADLHEYTSSALRTFFETTAAGVAIVVDDASPKWKTIHESHLKGLATYKGQECVVFRFPEWGGLTRSWNQGLRIARDIGCDYVICGNNDILFPAFWYQGLLRTLCDGYSLVGPVSNAPGVTAKKKQEVHRYFPDYTPDDSTSYINNVQKHLLDNYLGDVINMPINGFFQMAHLNTWWEGRYDKRNVYRPRNDRTSKGHKNLTPLMTLNEDELQGRWRRRGLRSGVVPSSFIFHYRAVTRGKRYRKGMWARKPTE
jgi:glycosyltransferase involved in cell wall biosynthesis